MTHEAVTTLARHFDSLPDPRIDRNKWHRLTDMITIAVCAVLCNADTWVDVELFGNAKLAWFRSFLALPHGIPSHDTFGRVFARINPERFQACFLDWVQVAFPMSANQVIAIDGKTVRGSHDRANGRAALHMVSAWAAENRLVIGQIDVDEKSNEITAIPVLLDALDLRGCTVTLDAMGCQKEIADRIVERGGDYVLAVKENQGILFDDVVATLTHIRGGAPTAEAIWDTHDEGHGRSEVRRYWVTTAVERLRTKDAWRGVRSMGMVESRRTTDAGMTTETRYYISSLAATAQHFGHAVRAHWGIENRLHRVLDVTFHEDKSRVRRDHGAKNLVVLRHIAANLLRQETTTKLSIRAKRLRAGWDDTYRATLLLPARRA